MSSGAAAVPTRPPCTRYPRRVCTRASCLCFWPANVVCAPSPPFPTPPLAVRSPRVCFVCVCVGSGFLSCFVTLPVVCGLFMSRTLAPSLALKWTLKLLRGWCWFAVRWWMVEYVAFSAFVQPDYTARARGQDAVEYKNRSLRKIEKPSKEEKKKAPKMAARPNSPTVEGAPRARRLALLTAILVIAGAVFMFDAELLTGPAEEPLVSPDAAGAGRGQLRGGGGTGGELQAGGQGEQAPRAVLAVDGGGACHP